MNVTSILNKTTIATVLTFAVGAGFAHAAVLTPNTTYDMFIKTGTSCRDNGDCTANGPGAAFTDNGNNLTDSNGITYGSAIGGDGWAGVIRFKTDASGGNFTALSYNLDQYPATPPDLLVTWADTPELMTGTVDAAGNMVFTPTGRMALSGAFADSIGVQPWNIDNATNTVTPTSNAWSALTTGTSTGQALDQFSTPISLTGTPLTSDGNGGWNALLVSSSNYGASWSLFEGSQYTEVWDVNIQTVVPVPAAAWLFGSGFIGLISFARRGKRNS